MSTTMIKGRRTVYCAVLTIAVASSAIAQPTLLPPGPPTTVSGRFGPRTQITTIPYTITTSGSYYLAATLFAVGPGAAITIDAGNVTIDLMGHSLFSGGFPGSPGIVLGPGLYSNITIHDGFVAGWDGDGIDVAFSGGGPASDVHVYNVTSTGNAGDGISVPSNSIVRDVIAAYNGGIGISLSTYCKLTNGVALVNGGDGISTLDGCHLSDCVASFNGFAGVLLGISSVAIGSTTVGNGASGFDVFLSCRVKDCVAGSNGTAFFFSDGFSCGPDGNSFNGCTAFDNTDSGFDALPGFTGNTAQDCVATFNGSPMSPLGDGFTGFRSVTQCTANGNMDNGIECMMGGHVVRNTCQSNGANGIAALADGNTIQQNHVAYNFLAGITTVPNPGPAGNLITNNTGHANPGGDFIFAPFDSTGPVIFGPGIIAGPATSNISYP